MRRRIDFEIAALIEVFQKIRHRDRLLRGEKLDIEISLNGGEAHRVRVRIIEGIAQVDLRRYAGENVWLAMCVLMTGGAFAAIASGAAADNARRKTMARFIEGDDCNRSANARHPAVSAARIIF